MTQWPQHGSYSLCWKGDVLLACYIGAWNEVAARNLHRDALALWQQRGPQPWGLLSDAREWEAGTPEALDAWWVFFEDATRHGMVAVTDVMPSRFHRHMVQAMADRASQLVNYRASPDVEDGLTWLASTGLRVS
jgi:hypothetical protein